MYAADTRKLAPTNAAKNSPEQKCDMRTHIDWLTFTMPMSYGDQSNEAYASAVQTAFHETFGEDLVQIVFGGAWKHAARSRAPYTDCWVDEENGISLYASPNLVHCCVEVEGTGCERFIQLGVCENILARIADRITRIDIASDIETATQPTEFVAKVSHDRMRANGMQNSETGQTCYVGSKKSDRYARVYRYYAPHPRAHLLRVEAVFRRKYAKSVARAILDTSLASVAAASGKAFGWAHGDWDATPDDSADISITAPERGASSTISWIVRSVAPAIRRLILDGTIRDPEAFFKTYFLPEE
jgi:ribosomal protein L19E